MEDFMKKFFEDFKSFISRGNVIDLAVGIIIGGAFTAIVKSLVADLLMPIIGLFGFGSVKELKYVFTPAVVDPVTGAEVTAEHALYYGNFIQAVIDFLIIAFVIFIIIKVITAAANRAETLKKKLAKEEAAKVVEAAPEVAPEPSPEVVLLTEIRDALKKKD